MEKLIIFIVFISLFIFLIRKDNVYLIPMIFLFFTNINGLLDWEDFAQHGSVKFPDYGLLLGLLIIAYFLFFKRDKIESILNTKDSLLTLIFIHVVYYFFLFIYSFIVQGSLEWPIKIGRTYLYEISIFVFYFLLAENPVLKYRKVFTFFKIYTIIFSIMYIVYNYFYIDFYANEAYDVINTDYGVVNRNFAAYPYFLMYFYCISLINLLNRKGNFILNISLVCLFLICMISVLTRGTVIIAGIIFLSAFLISSHRKQNILYILFFFGLVFFVLKSIHYFETPSFLTLEDRISEIAEVGIGSTVNFEYRTKEFVNILNNVIQYNPLFGFGFVNTRVLGFHFNDISAGSPDNGFTNLLGISGFVGFVLFILILVKWGLLNLKIQRLKIDDYSKAHFLYLISIILSFMNGSSNSYLQSFGLFLIYDFLIYRLYCKTQI
jgi:hypothetical protein